MFVSSFSEYTVVDIAHVTKIDPQTPPNRALLFTCGIAAGKSLNWSPVIYTCFLNDVYIGHPNNQKIRLRPP